MNWKRKRIGSFFLLSLFVFAAFSGSPAHSIEEESALLGQLHFNSDDPKIKEAAETFFVGRLDGELDKGKLSKAIERFYFRWPVYSISVWKEVSEGKTDLFFQLRSSPIITEVDFRGNFTFGDDKLLNQIDLREGGKALPIALEKTRVDVLKYYQRRGFPEVEVEVSGREKEKKSGEIEIDVLEGKPCRFRRIAVQSQSTEISSKDLADWFRMKPKSRCDLLRVERRLQRLREELRERGFLSSEIEAKYKAVDDSTKAMDLFVEVTPGQKIEIDFSGNTYVFERSSKLKKIIRVSEEGQFNDAWLSLAKDELLQFYQGLGYPDVGIEITDRAGESGHRKILFDIHRGRKIFIDDVLFEGNEGVALSDLRSQFWSTALPETKERTYVQSEIDRSAENLLAFYQSKGFLRAQVGNIKTERVGQAQVKVTYPLDEGEASFLSGIRVQGNSVFDEAFISEAMEVTLGDPIDPVVLKDGAQRLEELYREEGFKFAKVRIPPIEEIPPGDVVYRIQIEEGPQVRFGEISLQGNYATKDYVLLRELNFKKGDLYRPSLLRSSRRNLTHLGFFRSVIFEEKEFDSETGTEEVVIRVVERKKRSLVFRPGLSTDDGARAGTELTYRNIAGTGRSASLSGRINQRFRDSKILEYRAVLSYVEPRLFNLFDGRLSYIEERADEQQFDISRRKFILGLERGFLDHFRSIFQYQIEFRSPFNEDPDVVLSPFDEQRARFGYVTSLWDFDFRDDILNPKKGSFHRLKFDFYEKSLLSEAQFYQVTLRNSLFIPIYKRFRLAAGVRAGVSGTFGATAEDGSAIPIEKRFRLGGNSSLRGFQRNCVGGLEGNVAENCGDTLDQAPGGNSFFNYMVDLLIPLFGDLDFAIFTDGGQAFLTNGDWNPLDIRVSAGAGLRYNTFFGPFRLDYGIKLDRRTGENFGGFHVSVGQF